LACGDQRKVTDNCIFMAHEIQGGLDPDGPYWQNKDRMGALDKTVDMFAIAYARHTKHTKKWWSDLWKERREVWWDAKEMLKHGIVDEIIERTE
jgi:ATP-dependent protease ClpP protease subunit